MPLGPLNLVLTDLSFVLYVDGVPTESNISHSASDGEIRGFAFEDDSPRFLCVMVFEFRIRSLLESTPSGGGGGARGDQVRKPIRRTIIPLFLYRVFA